MVLVGFMASGKTTVGRLIAERTGWHFVDLDREVERATGRSVEEIFRSDGEEAFRELEARVTREAALPERAVVATGGGWMARPELRDRWEGAVRVWLEVAPDDVLERLGDRVGSRPLLAGDSPARTARAILERRRGDYARAEVRVDTAERTPEEVADEVLRRVAEHIEPPPAESSRGMNPEPETD